MVKAVGGIVAASGLLFMAVLALSLQDPPPLGGEGWKVAFVPSHRSLRSKGKLGHGEVGPRRTEHTMVHLSSGLHVVSTDKYAEVRSGNGTLVYTVKQQRFFPSYTATMFSGASGFPSVWIRNKCMKQVPATVAQQLVEAGETFDGGECMILPTRSEALILQHKYLTHGASTCADQSTLLKGAIQQCIARGAPDGTLWATVFWTPFGTVCSVFQICPALASKGIISVGGL